jgi:hypothetical protein
MHSLAISPSQGPAEEMSMDAPERYWDGERGPGDHVSPGVRQLLWGHLQKSAWEAVFYLGKPVTGPLDYTSAKLEPGPEGEQAKQWGGETKAFLPGHQRMLTVTDRVLRRRCRSWDLGTGDRRDLLRRREQVLRQGLLHRAQWLPDPLGSTKSLLTKGVGRVQTQGPDRPRLEACLPQAAG